MRVIAGEARGRPLKWPKEPRIRPTADLVRGAIFSALESLDVDWSRTLDLYAGTGALGIEALSRGAEEAHFVEHDPKCCAIIKENLERTGFAQRARVYRLETRKALRTLEGPYDIIFLDPPYFAGTEQSIMEDVTGSDLAKDQTTIVLEHSQKVTPPSTSGHFRMIKSLHHGDTCVSIFQHEAGRN